ncbi:RNA polymerase sigma factor [Nakamurella sp. A5-74]|uniref:RNA polymerase sigma factor n=1 Tax=Nakamurella sp. A5-74 TaxID=3158264 RepID=A0AAU8DQG8_9ACTN
MTLEPLIVATDDFAAFVEPHLATLSWLAARLAPGEHESLVQQALTRAWYQRSRFDPDESTERAWLCSVLADQCRRVDGRARSELLTALAPQQPGAADQTPNGPIAADPADGRPVGADPPAAADPVKLARALELLTAPQRRAVDCHYLVGLTLADTGAVTGCSVGAVGSALSDARLRLHRALTPTSAQSADPDTGPDEPGLDPVRDAHRSIDALLRVDGAQFRAGIPPAMFEQPSSRMSMLGRRARLSLIGGIAVAVVGIVVAGAVIVRQPAASVTPLPVASTSAGVQYSKGADQARSTTTGYSRNALPVDVGPAASPRGSRPAWPSTGLISAFPSAAGAAGGVRVAWEVATGDLLVGIPETLLCNDRQIRLRLDSTTALHLDLYGGIGPDQRCKGDSLRVVAFAPLVGQNDGQSVVRVTGRSGTLLLPGLSGLELDRSGTGAGLPSVSGVRTVGHSPDVDVHWQPETGRLLVSARGCGAFATADLGNGTEVTVVIRPTDELCPGLPETAIHVIQIPPHPPGSPFQVVVFNSTRDRSGTTDVFTVTATSLRPSPTSSVEPAKLVRLETRHQKLLGIDRIGRSADNKLHLEVSLPPGNTEVLVPSATLLADQSIEIAQDGAAGSFGNDSSRPVTMVYQLDIPPVSDVHRPLQIRIGDEEILLPAL